MIIAYIPLLFAIAGLLLFALASNPKVVRVGEIMFFCGFLVTMFSLASKTVHLLQ